MFQALIVKPDGSKPESDLEKAEIVQTVFSSVFTREDLENMPLPSQVEFDSPLNDIKFTSEGLNWNPQSRLVQISCILVFWRN